MRKVMVLRHVLNDADKKWHLEEAGIAEFHQWGLDSLEYDAGPANFTVAIVEWPDGKIELIAPAHVRFIDRQPC